MLSKRYLTGIGCKDVIRSPGAFIASALVVAGICLPLLLLIGLKRGLVRQFAEDINKSPTAREIQLWVVQEKNILTEGSIAELMQEYPAIETVIPGIKKVVKLRDGSGSDPNIEGLTLLATDESDPSLSIYEVNIPSTGERTMILSKYAAEKLDVNTGDMVQVEVIRDEGKRTGRAYIVLRIKDIIDTGRREASIGYVHWKLLERIEEYQSGEAVPEFGWLSFQSSLRPQYRYFLGFSRSPLTKDDEKRLRARGLRAELLSDSDPNDLRRHLYGLLGDKAPPNVYMIRANTSDDSQMVGLNFTGPEIEAILDTDMVAIPWNEPMTLDLGGESCLFIGLTVRPRWLRERFFHPNCWFETDEPELRAFIASKSGDHEPAETLSLKIGDNLSVPLSVQFVSPAVDGNDKTQMLEYPKDSNSPVVSGVVANDNDQNTVPADSNQVELSKPVLVNNQTQVLELPPEDSNSPVVSGVIADDDGQNTVPADSNQTELSKPVPMSVTTAPEPNQGSISAPGQTPPVVVIPTALLAHVHQFKAGKARFDPDARMFVRLKSPVHYYQARVFAKTLDDVLILDNELSKHFAVQANKKRILEMKGYERTLMTLVTVVGGGVFLFGLVTVTSLLSDISARKKGDIGILSCMGISKGAAVYFVIVRATLTGLLGCIIAYFLSIAISVFLDKFGVSCSAPAMDLIWLLPFSILCCWAGAILPATRSAMLDPVQCLREAKSR
ncbi:MAG: ABC transporter permease [Desulfatiglandales bacterium]